MPDSTPADPHNIRADSIANDGTIAGSGTGGALVFWRSDAGAWEWIPATLAPAMPKLISLDGSSVVATDDSLKIMTWSRVDGWATLAGATVTQSAASNVSRNFPVRGGRRKK